MRIHLYQTERKAAPHPRSEPVYRTLIGFPAIAEQTVLSSTSFFLSRSSKYAGHLVVPSAPGASKLEGKTSISERNPAAGKQYANQRKERGKSYGVTSRRSHRHHYSLPSCPGRMWDDAVSVPVSLPYLLTTGVDPIFSVAALLSCPVPSPKLPEGSF